MGLFLLGMLIGLVIGGKLGVWYTVYVKSASGS